MVGATRRFRIGQQVSNRLGQRGTIRGPGYPIVGSDGEPSAAYPVTVNGQEETWALEDMVAPTVEPSGPIPRPDLTDLPPETVKDSVDLAALVADAPPRDQVDWGRLPGEAAQAFLMDPDTVVVYPEPGKWILVGGGPAEGGYYPILSGEV